MIASTATAPYGIYHFGRFAVYSVLTNMIAVPVSGVLVMPFALVAVLLMPLGLEKWPLIPMGWGVDICNWSAKVVAALPYSAVSLPGMPLWGMVVFTLGGAWLCFWRSGWRWWGTAAMAVGLASVLAAHKPDLIVDGRADAFAVRLADDSLLIGPKGGRITRESWTRKAGPASAEDWPLLGASADGRLDCDVGRCLYRAKGRTVALVLDDDALERACDGADLVIARMPSRHRCKGAGRVIDRFDLWRRGSHAVWLEPGGIAVENVLDWQGERPWSYHPRKRRVIDKPEARPDEVPATQPPPPAEDD
jgi:competence protein ComEC